MKGFLVGCGLILAILVSVVTLHDQYILFSLEKLDDIEGIWPSDELEEEKTEDPELYAERVNPYVKRRYQLAYFSHFFGEDELADKIIRESYERYSSTPLEDHHYYMMMGYLEVVMLDDANKLKEAQVEIGNLLDRYPEHPKSKNLNERFAQLRLRTGL